MMEGQSSKLQCYRHVPEELPEVLQRLPDFGKSKTRSLFTVFQLESLLIVFRGLLCTMHPIAPHRLLMLPLPPSDTRTVYYP